MTDAKEGGERMDMRIDGFCGSVKLGPTGQAATRVEVREKRCRKLSIFRLMSGKYALILGPGALDQDEVAWLTEEPVAKIIMRLLWGEGENKEGAKHED